GFAKNDDVKDFALDLGNAALNNAAGEVLHTRAPLRAPASQMDPRFLSHFGAPADGQVVLLPLLLKDKVAALVYADSGASGPAMDAGVFEVWVRVRGLGLEFSSLRKQAVKDGAADANGFEKSEPAPAAQKVSSFSDPFAGHAPSHAAAVAQEQPSAAA